MKVTGTAALSAPPEKVFEALNDPQVLVRTIPGVESLEQVEENRYKMAITAGVASIKGTYEGQVTLSEQQPPESFVLHAKGAGAPGTVDATVQVRIESQNGGSQLSYDADAIVGGMVGGVGQRMLTGVAEKMAGQFFGNVDAVLAGTAPEPVPAGAPAAEPAPAGAEQPEAAAAQPAGAGAVFRAPAAAGAAAGGSDLNVPFWIVLAGVGAGAFWTLMGVLVGWRIARNRD